VWYLEQKEAEMYTQEDLEAERALAKKVLRKVVKVRSVILSVPRKALITLTGTILDAHSR
jgi:hypothetical protein